VAVAPAVSSGPRSVAVADLDGDGYGDLVGANSGTNTLTVLINTRAGGFATGSVVSVGNAPVAVTPADLNRDGYPDVISANQSAGTLTVLTNNGAAGFGLEAT